MTSIACAGIFVFGIVMALLGVIMPSLSATLGFNLAEAGMLFLVMNGSMLATSLAPEGFLALSTGAAGHQRPNG